MTSPTTRPTAPLQKAAAAFGVVFLLVGVLGFIPGITTQYDEMTFAGHHSDAQLLGIFGVSVLHNVVHLAFGVAGLLLARSWAGARWFLIGGGAVYGVLTIYGLLVDRHDQANFVPLDQADNWLHAFLTVAMIGAGAALGRTDANHTATHR